MKVLITGASGFIGQSITKILHHKGIPIVSIGRSKPDYSINHIDLDLLKEKNFKPILQKIQATHLLHLAWHTEHSNYWTSPLNFSWVDSTIKLVYAFCATNGQHIVMAGSCAEYDWSEGRCDDENTQLNPNSIYGICKDVARRRAKLICNQFDVSCAWGRVFFPFGPGQSTHHLIPSLINYFQGKRAPFAIDTEAYRDFMYISDVAEAFITLLLLNKSGTFNISSGKVISIAEIINMIASILKVKSDHIFSLKKDFGNRSKIVFGNNEKLKNLGWYQKIELRHGLEQLILNNKIISNS